MPGPPVAGYIVTGPSEATDGRIGVTRFALRQPWPRRGIIRKKGQPSMKTLVRLVIGIPLILIALGVMAYIYRNSLVASGIEEAGTYALGTETTLGSAGLDIGGGSLDLEGFKIANPPGFEREHFLVLEKGHLEVEVGSVLDDTVQIPAITFSGLTMELSPHEGTFNYKAILDSIQRFEMSESSESESQYRIEEITISNVAADIVMLPSGGDLTRGGVSIEQLRITNLGTRTRSLSELSATLVTGILEGVVKAGGSLPDQVMGGLRSGLSGVKSGGDMQVSISGVKTTGALNEIKGLIQDAVKGDLDVKDKLEDLGKGLLGGDKE